VNAYQDMTSNCKKDKSNGVQQWRKAGIDNCRWKFKKNMKTVIAMAISSFMEITISYEKKC